MLLPGLSHVIWHNTRSSVSSRNLSLQQFKPITHLRTDCDEADTSASSSGGISHTKSLTIYILALGPCRLIIETCFDCPSVPISVWISSCMAYMPSSREISASHPHGMSGFSKTWRCYGGWWHLEWGCHWNCIRWVVYEFFGLDGHVFWCV